MGQGRGEGAQEAVEPGYQAVVLIVRGRGRDPSGLSEWRVKCRAGFVVSGLHCGVGHQTERQQWECSWKLQPQ